jgi:starch synthase
VPQKGILLLQAAIEITLKNGGSFAILGSSPIPEIQQQFDELKEKYKNNPHVFLEYQYRETLAHQLYAALDFILVPSIFEPCGLTQLIGLRYGAIPIVRSTGGLKDTVFDCEDGKNPLEKRNGFVFQEPTIDALQDALHRALTFWHTDEATCLAMLRRTMQIESGWKKPAKEYLKVYAKDIPNPGRLANLMRSSA